MTYFAFYPIYIGVNRDFLSTKSTKEQLIKRFEDETNCKLVISPDYDVTLLFDSEADALLWTLKYIK